jgi:hypothetical protein
VNTPRKTADPIELRVYRGATALTAKMKDFYDTQSKHKNR